MGSVEAPAGTQARLRGLRSDVSLNGKACVSLGTSGGRATVRLATGRQLVVPLDSLEPLAAPGRLAHGTRVVLAGLEKAPELNGRFGTVALSFGPPSGRQLVDVEGAGAAKAIRYENLVLLDPEAAAQESASSAIGYKTTVANFVDPGINGLAGIVLCTDSCDPSRLVLWMPSLGRAMSFRPENLAGAAEKATKVELASCQAPLREAFYTEVRKHLWGLPREQAPLMSLTAPGSAKDNPLSREARMLAAWHVFKAACGEEAPLMFSVLRSRSDLFEITRDHAGNENISLTEASRRLNVDEGVPEPPTKKRKVERDSGRQATDELARALFVALQRCTSEKESVPISQLGSDIRVAQLRRDHRFRKVKLFEVLKDYPSVFQLVAEEAPGTGWLVSLAEGAEAALPQRVAGESAPMGAGDVLPDPEALNLPPRLENPQTLPEKLQALRIEVIHALFRHGGAAAPQQLGQDPGVQRARRELPKARTLLEMIQVFTDNFTVVVEDAGAGVFQVHLESMDVSDMRPAEDWVQRRKG